MKTLTQDLKNKFMIYKLVKKHFGFEKKSLDLFKYRLFYNPHVNKEYKKIIGDSKDLRVRVKIDSDTCETYDNGWELFKSYFRYFCTIKNIEYQDFRSNKKGNVKLFKLLIKFYIKNIFYASRDLSVQLSNFLNYTFSSPREDGLLVLDDESFNHENHLIKYKDIDIPESYKESIRDQIRRDMEEIGKKSIPKKCNLELVLSLNFADWFLCSTRESWGSCLSLESKGEGLYWSGLPGLIGDKNRAIIYLTNGDKKCYNGIEVDKIIARSWVLTTRNKINEEKFSLVRNYPVSVNFCSLAKKYFNIDLIKEMSEEFQSQYSVELLFHRVSESLSYLSWIYNDNIKIRIARKNKAKFFPLEYGYFTGPKSDCHPNVMIKSKTRSFDPEWEADFDEDLSFLIKHDLSLEESFAEYRSSY